MCSKQTASCGKLRQVFKTEHRYQTRSGSSNELSSRWSPRVEHSNIKTTPALAAAPRWGRLFVASVETSRETRDQMTTL
jgi:hypothetical protein